MFRFFRGTGETANVTTTPRRHITRPGEKPPAYEPPPIPTDPLVALSDNERAALPNLLVIGAGKCGTSALHHYLSLHPDIAMANRKELQLFGGNRWIERLPAYAQQFDPTQPLRGESSPTYSMDPFVPNVPEQIAAVLGTPKLIYLVGDPIARTVAHWSEQRVLRLERRSLAEALADIDEPTNPYVAASRFGHQLSRYRSTFRPEHIMVVDQADLRHRRSETLHSVFDFLGVDRGFSSDSFNTELNSAATKMEVNAFGGWLEDKFGARARRFLRVQHLTAQPARRPELPHQLRDRLVAHLRPDIERFRALTDKPFADWFV